MIDKLLAEATRRSVSYLKTIDDRSVAPSPDAIGRIQELGGALPATPCDPQQVLAMLDEIGSPATTVNAGGRYFGFVNGGTLPAALAANWLAGAWDQNAGPSVCSPIAAALEDITIGWLCDFLGLPDGTGGTFVTGASMANFCGLAAARHALLRRKGWDVERDGLFGAPPIAVVVGDEVHATLLKALSLWALAASAWFASPWIVRGECAPIVCQNSPILRSSVFKPAM